MRGALLAALGNGGLAARRLCANSVISLGLRLRRREDPAGGARSSARRPLKRRAFRLTMGCVTMGAGGIISRLRWIWIGGSAARHQVHSGSRGLSPAPRSSVPRSPAPRSSAPRLRMCRGRLARSVVGAVVRRVARRFGNASGVTLRSVTTALIWGRLKTKMSAPLA